MILCLFIISEEIIKLICTNLNILNFFLLPKLFFYILFIGKKNLNFKVFFGVLKKNNFYWSVLSKIFAFSDFLIFVLKNT